MKRVGGAAAFAAAFAVLAALVVEGKLRWLDDYALAHWMPDFTPGSGSALSVVGLWRPFALGLPWWHKALDVWTYPASFLVSGLVVCAAFVLLRRRGQTRAGVIWVAVWLAGNAIEYVGKRSLDRPRLHYRGHAISSFHDSFPSGHTIRSLVVASVIVYLWRRALWPVLAWVVLVWPFLVVTADHTPSDVLGGLCVGGALLLLAREALPVSVGSTELTREARRRLGRRRERGL